MRRQGVARSDLRLAAHLVPPPEHPRFLPVKAQAPPALWRRLRPRLDALLLEPFRPPAVAPWDRAPFEPAGGQCPPTRYQDGAAVPPCVGPRRSGFAGGWPTGLLCSAPPAATRSCRPAVTDGRTR